MFFASKHQFNDRQLFLHEVQALGEGLPKTIKNHLTLVYVEDNVFQCIWEASDILPIQEYMSAKLAQICESDYYALDPMTTIA